MKRPVDTDKFIHSCHVIDLFLQQFRFTGILAAFSVGATLASDEELTEEDFDELCSFAKDAFLKAKEIRAETIENTIREGLIKSKKSDTCNIIDITDFLKRDLI